METAQVLTFSPRDRHRIDAKSGAVYYVRTPTVHDRPKVTRELRRQGYKTSVTAAERVDRLIAALDQYGKSDPMYAEARKLLEDYRAHVEEHGQPAVEPHAIQDLADQLCALDPEVEEMESTFWSWGQAFAGVCAKLFLVGWERDEPFQRHLDGTPDPACLNVISNEDLADIATTAFDLLMPNRRTEKNSGSPSGSRSNGVEQTSTEPKTGPQSSPPRRAKDGTSASTEQAG